MTNPNKKLEGILPAICSPCDERKVFLGETFGALAESLYEADINGLYVCGATGDGYNMCLAERKRATEIAVEVSGRHGGIVIVHVGNKLNHNESPLLAEHAAQSGAEAISSMPPKDFDQKELIDYYSNLVKAANIPVLLYLFPKFTGPNPSMDEITELLDIPGVIGLKMSDWNLFLMKALHLARPEAVIFSGFDEILCPALMYGVNGGIGMLSNLFPKLFVSIYKAVQAGDFVRAMELQQKEISFYNFTYKYSEDDIFEFLMAKRGFGPRCFRNLKRAMKPETLRSIEPELDERIAVLEDELENV